MRNLQLEIQPQPARSVCVSKVSHYQYELKLPGVRLVVCDSKFTASAKLYLRHHSITTKLRYRQQRHTIKQSHLVSFDSRLSIQFFDLQVFG